MNTPSQSVTPCIRLSPVARLRNVLLARLVTLLERFLKMDGGESLAGPAEEEWTLEECAFGWSGPSFVRVFYSFR